MKNKKILPPSFVLVRPQMGENIGAAARAMANFGITDLRLVTPRDGWPNAKAKSMAAGAIEEGHVHITLFDNLSSALEDKQYAYATTARTRYIEKSVFSPDNAAQDSIKRGTTAFVFGPERTGLETNEIAQCHALIRIPTTPDFSSLNLGQSVLLMAYALTQQTIIAPENNYKAAPLKQFDYFFDRFTNMIDEIDFFKEPSLRPVVLKNLRAMLMRADMTEQNINTLHGIITALTSKKKP